MPLPTKIFVGNLSSDTNDDDLRPLFEQFGRVTECDVLRNFGFVHMSVEEEANQAITELHGSLVKGQRINVEKSTGSRGGGGGRGGSRGGGKMSGGRGRGAPRGRGGPMRGGDRDYDPYPPPRSHPYSRDPYYDYYDRLYADRLPPPRSLHDDRRLPYDREDRLPPPRDPYDRYAAARYPPPVDRYPSAYDRYPPPRSSADPYERPPPDYYRAYDGYDDTPSRRPAPQEDVAPPGVRPTPARPTPAANGFDDRRQEAPPSADSYSSSYSSYYDRFYNKGPANGSAPQPPQRPGAPLSGHGGPPVRGASAVAAAAAARKQDQQTMLQTGPIYF